MEHAYAIYRHVHARVAALNADALFGFEFKLMLAAVLPNFAFIDSMNFFDTFHNLKIKFQLYIFSFFARFCITILVFKIIRCHNIPTFQRQALRERNRP